MYAVRDMDKIRARSRVKVFVSLRITSIILPTGSCQLILQMYFTHYPPVGDKQNYFLLLSNSLLSYIPMIIFLICISLTVLKLHEYKSRHAKEFEEHAPLRARFVRKRKTAIILSGYLITFLFFLCRFMAFTFSLAARTPRLKRSGTIF